MAVYLLPEELLYPIVAEMADGSLKREAQKIKGKAEVNLAAARASTEWTKLPEPMVKRQQASQLTDIGMDAVPAKYGNDYIVWLEGGEDNRAALAIEFGHAPSGYYSGTATKAPHGLYILSSAAGFAGLNFTPAAGRMRGRG